MDLNIMKLYDKNELPPILYHYTSQYGLLEIIKTNTIWATDIYFLNDASEYSYAFDIAKRLLSKRLTNDLINDLLFNASIEKNRIRQFPESENINIKDTVF